MVEARARSKASPQAVYAAAKDSSRYPDWSMIGSFQHLRDGAGEPYGVGSLRLYRTWPLRLVEEITELTPERRVGYSLLSGLPFRNYRSSIDITPATGGGADIHWRSVFEPKIPGTRAACRAFMRMVIDQMTPLLARVAERLESERWT